MAREPSGAARERKTPATVECVIFTGKRRHHFLRPARKVAGDRKEARGRGEAHRQRERSWEVREYSGVSSKRFGSHAI